MPWVRFEDDFPIHRKVAGLSDTAYRVHTEAICWSSRNLTDGVIRNRELDQIRSRANRSAPDLVRRDLWHTADQHCDACLSRLTDVGHPWPTDGWVIHDYLAFQPSAVQVTKDRTAKTQRQARWRAAKTTKRGDTSTGTRGDASTPRRVDATPPRPAPKEGGSGAPAATARRQAADAGGGQQQPTVTSPPTELLNGVRAQLRTASHKVRQRAGRRENAVDELRALTDPKEE